MALSSRSGCSTIMTSSSSATDERLERSRDRLLALLEYGLFHSTISCFFLGLDAAEERRLSCGCCVHRKVEPPFSGSMVSTVAAVLSELPPAEDTEVPGGMPRP